MPTIEFVPRRLQEPPVVFRGMTSEELRYVIIAGALLGAVPGVVAAWFLGFATIPTLAVGGGMVSLLFGGSVIQPLRRGRSVRWLYQWVEWKLARAGIMYHGQYITESGAYRITGRDRRGGERR